MIKTSTGQLINLPSIIENATFPHLSISDETFTLRRLINSDLTVWTCDNCNFIRCDFSKSNLTNSVFTNCTFDGCLFTDTNLSCCQLDTVTIKNSLSYDANFNNTILNNCVITSSRFYTNSFHFASFNKVSFTNVVLPPPSIMLLANWKNLDDDLITDLMNYDSDNHPNPNMFQNWATNGGPCPYDSRYCMVTRAANFKEKRELWNPTKPHCRPYDLMIRVFTAAGCVFNERK